MRAWTLGECAPIDEHPLGFEEVPTPHPNAHEVRLRVVVCGICRTDLHIAEGDLAPGKEGLILGHEVVGVVDSIGEGVSGFRVGDSVGVTWLGRTCGECNHCLGGRENYCRDFRATGRDLDGGFAEYVVAHETSVFPLDGIRMPEEEMAPLLCAGVAGYCAFRLMNVQGSGPIGLYGFGPTAYYVLKVARHLGHEVLVSSRSERNLERALLHGAAWVGNAAEEDLPVELDAAIVFPPAGDLVELALQRIRLGGVLVLAPVAMSRIEIGDYSAHLWGRDIRTLYNVNRRDTEEFLRLARDIDMSLGTQVFPFPALQDAMIRVRHHDIWQSNAAVRIGKSH